MSGDPTAFDIDFDPTVQRMRGVAIHGNTPFDVPFISRITGNLWTGGCQRGLILPEHIVHVVSLYPWEAYRHAHEVDSKLAVKLYDSDDEPDAAQVDALARWVSVCMDQGPTLVHCQAGLNRSALVAGAALIHRGLMPEVAIDLLREQRSPAVLCNETFARWMTEREWPPVEARP